MPQMLQDASPRCACMRERVNYAWKCHCLDCPEAQGACCPDLHQGKDISQRWVRILRSFLHLHRWPMCFARLAHDASYSRGVTRLASIMRRTMCRGLPCSLFLGTKSQRRPAQATASRSLCWSRRQRCLTRPIASHNGEINVVGLLMSLLRPTPLFAFSCFSHA